MEAFFLNDSLIIFLFTLLLLFHFAHCKNSRSLREHSNRSMDLSLAQLSHLRSYQLETTMAAHADTHEIVVPEDLVRYEDTPLVNKHPIHPIVHRKVRPRGDSHCGDHLYGAVLMAFCCRLWHPQLTFGQSVRPTANLTFPSTCSRAATSINPFNIPTPTPASETTQGLRYIHAQCRC
jgi:hypothetical protein